MKFSFGSIALLASILFATGGTSIAQKSDISERDFLEIANRQAYWATAARHPRKETRTYEQLSDGKVTSSETILTEFLASDKYRITTTVISEGKTNTREGIQIGDIRYCKRDSADWQYCPIPPPAMAMGPIMGAQYSLELTADTKTYQRIYQSTREEKPFTTVDRIILNNDLSHRDRLLITTNSVTKEIVSRFTEKVEYGIKMAPIEAPIK